ncbi:MAG: tyrosine-type recombinase/integrase [Gammaproteobacteria bacterium]|nr:tyrosine-type recombinase/integrase [Gammaproteobacteria bacterium]
MPVLPLTQAYIDNELHCPPDKKRIEMCDANSPGLYAEVRSVNPANPTWYLRYRDATGKTCHERIGAVRDISLADARKKAKELKAKIALGANPQEQARAAKAVLTLKEFLEEKYTPYASARKRSFTYDESMIRLRIVPTLGHFQLNQLTRHQIQTFHTDLRTEGLAPATCDHHLKLLRAALNLAVQWEMLDKNPVAKVPLFREDNRLERYLTDDELNRLLLALRTSKARMVSNAMLFLLATGARLNEALQTRWEHIDKANRTWRIPAANSKSKRVRSVPLNDAALEVLTNLGTEGKNEYLFINTKTKEPLTVVNTVWGRIRIAAGLPNLRIHDLRHQHASMLVNSGRSLYEVQQILGHSDPSVTQRYAHLSTRTLQDASNSASEKIAQAAKQPPALRVVS